VDRRKISDAGASIGIDQRVKNAYERDPYEFVLKKLMGRGAIERRTGTK